MCELRSLYGTDLLDVEFAVDAENTIILFQVRPMVIETCEAISPKTHAKFIEVIEKKIGSSDVPHPDLYGSKTVYGIMPDWNPAEIIGVRPRPLALSLYQDLITNSLWAYQRDNYGYRNLRSFPLLVNFHGLPYIDVRVSFNSFLPKDIPADVAQRLIEYYIQRLSNAPELHDKVEFDIVFSCYTLDMPQRIKGLAEYGFELTDRRYITRSLRNLTNRIIGLKPVFK